MANKPLQFVLLECKMNVGPPQAGKTVQVAHRAVSPSRKYFTLTDVIYEQTEPKVKKGSKPNEEGGSSGNEGF